jgi:hypothetical protein
MEEFEFSPFCRLIPPQAMRKFLKILALVVAFDGPHVPSDQRKTPLCEQSGAFLEI